MIINFVYSHSLKALFQLSSSHRRREEAALDNQPKVGNVVRYSIIDKVDYCHIVNNIGEVDSEPAATEVIWLNGKRKFTDNSLSAI